MVGVDPNLHADPYYAKLTRLAPEFGEKVRDSLLHGGGDGAGIRGDDEFGARRLDDTDALGERPWQVPGQESGERRLLTAARFPRGERRVGGDNGFNGLRRTRHECAGRPGIMPAGLWEEAN